MSVLDYNKICCDKDTIQILIDKYCEFNKYTNKLEFNFEKVIPDYTKWESSNASALRIGDTGIYFDTKGYPENIFYEISKQNPDIEFEFDTVEEDSSCGYLTLKNGTRVLSCWYEDYDEERIDMLEDIIGGDYSKEREEIRKSKRDNDEEWER